MRRDGSERGSALIIVLIMMVTISGMVMVHLGEVRSEKRKIGAMVDADRAEERAIGEIERAKNLVNAAPYVRGHNTALWAAVNSDPPYVPGTEVVVERLGAPNQNEWFVLRATGEFRGTTKLAQTFVRQRSPMSAYNLFVIDHPVAVSGAPRGAIHSNKSIDFMFPWGTYRDQITAVEGFNYVAGATPENTRIWGTANPKAPPINDVLSGVNIANLQHAADTLKVTDDLVAEITFAGPSTKVDLFTPETSLVIPREGKRRVFDHMEKIKVRRRVPTYREITYKLEVPKFKEISEHVTLKQRVYRVYDVQRTRYEPIYEDRQETYAAEEPVWGTRTVARQDYEDVWIENDPTTTIRFIRALYNYSRSINGTWLRTVPGRFSNKKSGQAIKKALELISKDEEEEENEKGKSGKHFTKAADILAKAVKRYESGTNNWWYLKTSGADRALIDGYVSRMRDGVSRLRLEATKAATNRKKDGKAVSAGNLTIAELEAALAAGGRVAAMGHYAQRAVTNFIQVPYVASTRTVTKTRLRRVKVGRRLVTYADKERRFSHWETKHVMRKRKVKNGTQIVVRTRKERDGSRVIEQQLEVPVYRSEPYTWYETVVVPKTKVRTEVVPSRGTIYIEKAIHKMQGDVRGRMSVVSNDSMVVTGSIRYVDDAGRPRMLNGSDPDHDYVHNPAYTGDAVLLLLTSGDITYSTSVPPYLEINASMMTTGGKIAMQGINVSSDGKSVTVDQDVYDNPSNYIKASIRRLGGIVSRKRPVATFVNDDNVVINGFKSGVSMMDGNLVLADGGSVLPPNVLQIDRPTWVYKMAGRKVEVQ